MDISFKGKRAMVTGAGKGIGKEIAVLLHKLGAQVIGLSRTQEDLDALQEAIPGVIVIKVDLANVNNTKAAVAKAGDVDLLVNNAGIFIGESFLDATVEAWDQVMTINARASFLVGQLVARNMVARKAKGAIVNISSQASMIALKNHTTYCASKGAVDQLTRMMALELGEHGIRVNAVNPTVIITPMSQHWLEPAKAGPMLAKIPLNKFGTPMDVAATVAFLLSDYAGMITGAMLPIDGGYTAV